MYAALDACKVADYVIFVLSPNVEVNQWGDTLLRALQAQGMPEVVAVVAGDAPMEPKEKSGIMKSLLSFIQYFVPSQTRIFDIHHSADTLNALRTVSEGKPSDVKWRDGRSWILGERAEWADETLAITGYVRGTHLSASRLFHIPNFGDFQVSRVSQWACWVGLAPHTHIPRSRSCPPLCHDFRSQVTPTEWMSSPSYWQSP